MKTIVQKVNSLMVCVVLSVIFVSCENPWVVQKTEEMYINQGYPVTVSMEKLGDYLGARKPNSPNKPYTIKVKVDKDSITTIGSLLSVYAEMLYISLDLTGSAIPEIPVSAFSSCQTLVSVIIPNGVTDIRQDAFNGCTNLKSVTIPASVENIMNVAFTNCPSLTSVTFKGDAVPPNQLIIAFDGNLDTVYAGAGTYITTDGANWKKKS